ncbi:MmgE/PrpD family protein [Actinomadura rugatobispora]|uniref:MmgE/PrpD family protein n=1 Tax=Actinomadura rugatobispora TaxID=1994 RepID=A0ABW0ZXY0_9ACTN|nr:MmgE/PrpD family protein [Actinomadura rugatobispora]
MSHSAESVSQRLARFVVALDVEGLPADVRAAGALHALDAIGCGVAAFALGEAPYVSAAADEAGVGGPSTAIGGRGLPSTEAAMINGTLCHALDFDDTHPDSVVHVSAAVTPAALAAAEAHGASGADTLAAIVAGNEVSTRVGAAAGGVFHKRGFHPTGMAGVFGATAAACRVRRLDADRTAHALGIAGSMAGGLLEFLADGAETKKLHPGWAAQAGLTAARLAAHGGTGPASVFEGARGYYATYAHGFGEALGRLEALVGELGTVWETPRIAIKPYPACHYAHAPVDALREILAEHPITPEEVDSITAFSDETGVALVLEPAADKVRPRTPYDAKFSLPYCLGALLVHGKVDVTSFLPSAVRDERVLALTPKVGYELKQYSPRPDSFGGGVTLRTTDGRTHTAELRYQRGGEENPMSVDEIVAKFRANAALGLDADGVAVLEGGVLGLGGAGDLGFLSVLGAVSQAPSSPGAMAGVRA